jgi:hypothetical protein
MEMSVIALNLETWFNIYVFQTNLTEEEKEILSQTAEFQKSHWIKFMHESFPDLSATEASDIVHFDWLVILLNQPEPERYIAAYALQDECANMTNTTCLEALMDPTVNTETPEAIDDLLNITRYIIRSMNFTRGFRTSFTALWHSKLPCFDTIGMSAEEEGERGILKQCRWKGRLVPCSGIFTTFPTDRGMCCSFNVKAANNIFSDSHFSSLVQQLQEEDYNTSFGNKTLPEWFTDKGEPTAQTGSNMGLEVVLDAHSDKVESLSISRDFEGFTGLITDSGSFPLTFHKGFEIRPGHNNLVAVTATVIDADEDLRNLEPTTRKCLFPDETKNIKLFKNYSQANCFLECSLMFAQRLLASKHGLTHGCTPWYFPFVDDSFEMCDPYQTAEILEAMKNDVPVDECRYCLPGV